MNIDYDVVSSSDIIIFLQKVDGSVESGYKLQGGVSVSEGCYYQAVMKDLDEQKINNEKRTT